MAQDIILPDLSTFGGRLFAARCWAGFGNPKGSFAHSTAGTGIAWLRWKDLEADLQKPTYREIEAIRLSLGVTYGYLFGERYDVEYFAFRVFRAF